MWKCTCCGYYNRARDAVCERCGGERGMTRLSEKQARELLGDKYPEPKKHKYNARKTTIDGVTFDSQREAEFYCELKLLVKAGKVERFELQPEFVLQEGFTYQGKKYRSIIYRADFRIVYPDGQVEIVDVKGHKTKEYQIKKKLLLARYPEINFREVA